ncbi:MAG: glycosyltransferase family 39 protein [Clostridiales bacterium]|nr:glycosyltransferase family 39 protein [Clostridiales bacterium]
MSLFFVLLFRCGAVCDSEFLSNSAIEFMKGNYEAFEEGTYLQGFPFQLGMIALLELIYRLFGIENYIAFQVLNVIAIIWIIYLLNRITWELFENEQVVKWEALISMGMLPLFMYATFVYGDIIGISLGMGAVYWTIRYLKTDQWRYLLLTGLLFMCAVVVKSNINVLLIAFMITMLLKMFQTKRWGIFIAIIGVVFLSQIGVQTVNMVYTSRAGIEKIDRGVPKLAWIAMSLQEAKETDNGCGWYNGYNMNVYRENGFDRQETTEACLENIQESLQRFVQYPKAAIYFFYKKFVSQWNDPTFQSLIVNEWSSRYTENKFPLADIFIYGMGRRILSQMMNFYHLLVLTCSVAGSVYLIRNWRLERAYLMLNVFGGFLFHMIWEAKGRYILGYFIFLLPIAAVGLVQILRCFEQMVIHRKGRRIDG